MSRSHFILKKYWGYESFREPQEEIIENVLKGKDAFVLMPTGGGKSLCFQVPGMVMEGICLVISPLIALMKDQVENLRKRGIKALALTGGHSVDEIIQLMDNCKYGNYSFLYLSPERLQSDWILDSVRTLPISLIAVDEAHCVSQWGHDFRPAYLKIRELKEVFPGVPFLALTASAPPSVQKDILEQLGIGSARIFKKSFLRENLAYMVYKTEDKWSKIKSILYKNPDSSIIYVRNRKSCHDVNEQLKSMGFTATYYHGGLDRKEKGNNMELWMENKVQVMVATNAFGMGIDKPDVRTVIHIHLPENLENYFQEAGRAGRDGRKSFSILLYGENDLYALRSQVVSFMVDKSFLSLVYFKLCSYFQIAYGEGMGQEVSFSLNKFCTQYQLPLMKTYQTLQFLDRQGVITFLQEFSEKVTIRFLVDSREVIRYVSLHPADEEVIVTLLRTYPGVYDMPVIINPALVARKSQVEETSLDEVLRRLHERQIIDYESGKNDSCIIFNEIREDNHTINRVVKYLETQNNLKQRKLGSVVEYVTDHSKCKTRYLLEYFGEDVVKNCGVCSYCIEKKKPGDLSSNILLLLEQTPMSSKELQGKLSVSDETLIFALRNLLDEEYITLLPDNRFRLR